MTPDQVDGLGVALNEAEWHDLSVDGDSVSALLTVLARDENGDEVADPRRTLRMSRCARLVASYRQGLWDDPDAPVVPLDLAGLRDVLRRHGGTPVYGWEFVDAEDRRWPSWQSRLSLDLPLGGPGGHVLTLFQDIRGEAHLDCKVWFAELSVVDGTGTGMDLDDFIAAGVRWWDAMYAGQPSDRAPGIVPLAEERRRWWHLFRRTPR
ncbi:MAG TPA: hypothetical protein VFV89_16720 [Nocardioides sp.]|uniref:hypothetical protein n=1 Tax=Nocardioides sp. TaxID=35761 RepID=UPI002E379A47|nr:hypothetical protein [Nocardioides sp.]HEX5089452.1 hypothetical protein [Nocardioides sp.]